MEHVVLSRGTRPLWVGLLINACCRTGLPSTRRCTRKSFVIIRTRREAINAIYALNLADNSPQHLFEGRLGLA
jgi:hypothetical protein